MVTDVRPVSATAAVAVFPVVLALLRLWVVAAVEAVCSVAVDLHFTDEDDVFADIVLVESKLPVTHLGPQR